MSYPDNSLGDNKMFEGMIGFAIAILLGIALAEYAKIKKGLTKQFAWLTTGALLFFVAAVFDFWPTSQIRFAMPAILPAIVEVLAFIAVVIGGLWAGYKLLFD